MSIIKFAIGVGIVHVLFVAGSKAGWWGTDPNGRIHLNK